MAAQAPPQQALAGSACYDQADLAQFRGEILGPLTLVPAGVSIVLLYVTVDGNRLANWLPILAFAVACSAALAARWLGDGSAAVCLTIGLVLALTATVVVYPGTPLACAFAAVAAIAGLSVGPRFGLATAAASTVAVLGVRPSVADDVALTAVALTWAIGVLFWLATRPVYIALGWAWSAYLDGLQKTEELRDRQGELGRLSKSLQETCIQLEVLNQELERARLTAEEARRLKNEFAAAVSHELRTPLNLIIGFSEMMVLSPDDSYDEPLPLSYRTDVEAIYRNACHISNLIDDILDLSQIDAHRMALRKEMVSLGAVVENATAGIVSLFREKNLWIEVDLPDSLPTVNVDPTRIRQVLTNLLANAARCTDRGGVTISATCRNHEVLVAVADTGIGMAPAEIPHAFETFRQIGERARPRAGHGLGLAISKRFIEMHGGSMWAESQPGEGTTFYFTLPLQTEVVATSESAPGRGRLNTRMAEGVTTIVALDDEGTAARILERYLEGYHVFRASSPDDVRRAAAEEPVRALIRASVGDRRQPRESQPSGLDLGNIPVVDCPFEVSWAGAQELGVADYLVKPVSSAQLGRAFQRLGRSVQSVLIVDDDGDVVRLLTKMVRAMLRSCQVWEAQDGKAGLEILRERRPEVVLLDLLMPEMDGYALLDAMRCDPALSDTAVIVVSARSREQETVVAASIGIRRPGGLGVGEAMRCLRASLDALLAPGARGTAPGQPAGLLG